MQRERNQVKFLFLKGNIILYAKAHEGQERFPGGSLTLACVLPHQILLTKVDLDLVFKTISYVLPHVRIITELWILRSSIEPKLGTLALE